MIRKTNSAQVPAPRIIGVDDLAKRKVQSYGTIIVKHETSQIIALLPDRTPETLSAWLRNHPSIEVVSRDRAEEYAQGIRDGAPNAIQVADCWHLLKNLTETLVKELQHHLSAIKHSQQQPSAPQDGATPQTTAFSGENAPAITMPSTTGTPSDQRRQTRAETVHELHQQGWTQKDIAHHLDVNPKTVSRDLKRSLPLTPRVTQRHSLLAPFTSYLATRWHAGYRNATQLFREIQLKGYAGRITIVRSFIRGLKHTVSTSANVDSSVTKNYSTQRQPTLHSLAWLITQPKETLTETQTKAVEQIHHVALRLDEAIGLALEFAHMVRKQLADAFDTWLNRASHAESGPLESFAHGLRQDYAAVHAALSLP